MDHEFIGYGNSLQTYFSPPKLKLRYFLPFASRHHKHALGTCPKPALLSLSIPPSVPSSLSSLSLSLQKGHIPPGFKIQLWEMGVRLTRKAGTLWNCEVSHGTGEPREEEPYRIVSIELTAHPLNYYSQKSHFHLSTCASNFQGLERCFKCWKREERSPAGGNALRFLPGWHR